MPTDIALSTNTPTGSLELRQAQRLPDGSGYAAFLVVRSGGFAAALPFLASIEAWSEFGRRLDGVTSGDSAPARLRAREGDDVVAISGAGDGRIGVSGSLHEPEGEQSLRFRFLTASHGLAAFAAGVRRAAEG